MKNKPTEEGYYVWKSEGHNLHPCACKIYKNKHEVMMVNFHLNSPTEHSLLAVCADREWFKVDGLPK